MQGGVHKIITGLIDLWKTNSPHQRMNRLAQIHVTSKFQYYHQQANCKLSYGLFGHNRVSVKEFPKFHKNFNCNTLLFLNGLIIYLNGCRYMIWYDRRTQLSGKGTLQHRKGTRSRGIHWLSHVPCEQTGRHFSVDWSVWLIFSQNSYVSLLYLWKLLLISTFRYKLRISLRKQYV